MAPWFRYTSPSWRFLSSSATCFAGNRSLSLALDDHFLRMVVLSSGHLAFSMVSRHTFPVTKKSVSILAWSRNTFHQNNLLQGKSGLPVFFYVLLLPARFLTGPT